MDSGLPYITLHMGCNAQNAACMDGQTIRAFEPSVYMKRKAGRRRCHLKHIIQREHMEVVVFSKAQQLYVRVHMKQGGEGATPACFYYGVVAMNSTCQMAPYT